jgi:hypothetical protein
MDISEDILKNNRYKEILDRLSSKTLQNLVQDRLKALEEARKGIQQEEPERLHDVEYLEALADGIQQLAQMVLEHRDKKE